MLKSDLRATVVIKLKVKSCF